MIIFCSLGFKCLQKGPQDPDFGFSLSFTCLLQVHLLPLLSMRACLPPNYKTLYLFLWSTALLLCAMYFESSILEEV